MAKERMVSTAFWGDKYIRSLEPNGKLLYMYFFTNDLANIAGIYETTVDRIAFDTRLEEPEITQLMTKFEQDKKVFYVDGWVVVCNMPKHQKWEEKPKIKQGIDAILRKIPDSVYESIDTLSIPYTYPLNSFDLDLNSDLNSNLKGKEAKELLDYFFQKFLEKFNEKPIINGKKDIPLLKSLLETKPKNKLKELVDKFFEIDDPFIKRSGYTIGVFYSVINKLIISSQSNRDAPDPTQAALRRLRGVG